jgi:hypothetical protein
MRTGVVEWPHSLGQVCLILEAALCSTEDEDIICIRDAGSCKTPSNGGFPREHVLPPDKEAGHRTKAQHE